MTIQPRSRTLEYYAARKKNEAASLSKYTGQKPRWNVFGGSYMCVFKSPTPWMHVLACIHKNPLKGAGKGCTSKGQQWLAGGGESCTFCLHTSALFEEFHN